MESKAMNPLDYGEIRNTFISLLLSLLLVVFLIHPKAAEATGFGPSGATMSPPQGMSILSSKYDALNPSVCDTSAQCVTRTTDRQEEKQSIFGLSLNEKQSMEDLNDQLDRMIAGLHLQEQEQREPIEHILQEEAPIAQGQSSGEYEVEQRERFVQLLESQPYWFDYSAAFIGSVMSTMIMHPMDTIKTRLQIRAKSSNINSGIEDEASDELDSLTQNLYQGLSGNIWKEGPSSALSLSVYEIVKRGLLRTVATNPRFIMNRFQVYLLAGAAGELVGSVIQAPAEVVKSLLQSQRAKNPMQALSLVLGRPEGVIRAWSAAIWRDVPFSAIQLAVFELVKAYILNNPILFRHFDSSTLTGEAIIGAFAGGCGALLTNPTDVITARIITQQQAASSTESDDCCEEDTSGHTNTSISKKTEALGVFGMAQQIYNEGGMGAFFIGWQARVGYWSPAISIFLTTYCSIRRAGIEYDWFGQ